jgi:hypothetical protein
MGGNALKRTITFRKSPVEYESIKGDIIKFLKYASIKFSIPRELPGKESYGDLDVLYIKPKNFKIEDLIAYLRPNEIVRCKNSPVVSFDYKDFQIDFIESNNLEMSNFYLSFSDLGAILGRISNAYGLKFGEQGLWLNLMKNTIDSSISINQTDSLGKIMLTHIPLEICKFFGLDYDKYLLGFRDTKEIYDWIITTPYFNKNIFRKLNYDHRKRLEKRVMYIGFLDYIGISKDTIETTRSINDSKNGECLENLQNHAIKYFNKEDALDDVLKSIERREEIRRKFNAKLFIDLGVPNVMLRFYMDGFKNQIGDSNFDEWVLNTDSDLIKYYINRFIEAQNITKIN